MKKLLSFIALISISCIASADNLKYVDLFMGTAGDHGQVSPAAQLPLGLISVGPDCNAPKQHSGYDYGTTELLGFSVTRVSGVGGNGTGGNIRIRPAVRDSRIDIVKSDERAVPGQYSTSLSNGVGVRLIAGTNIAVEQYSFPKNAEKVLFVDFNSAIDPRRSECNYAAGDDRKTFSGWFKTSTTCNFGVYKLYFALNSDTGFTIESSDATSALIRFPDDAVTVELRIALSPVDERTAAAELAAKSPVSADAFAREARNKWKSVLGKVDVKGAGEEQKTLFYTSLYRMYLSPMDATSSDGRYRGTDGLTHQADGWRYYSSWSMWDTYRTKFPMFCLLDREAMSDICRSLVSQYRTGKLNWATMEESVPTVRTEHSQVVLLDAWKKGVRGFDIAEAFPYMEKEYSDGLVQGSRNGLTRNTPDQRMETIYDLWAMGEIAGAIGEKDKAEKYSGEAKELFAAVWTKEFMNIEQSYTLMRNNGLYQGTRWQYRWACPIFSNLMGQWHGSERLADELSEFFSRHLFNQGNEPDIQTPFLFNLFGHPERTDSLVHALLTDEGMIHLYGGNAEYPEPFIGRAFRVAKDGYAPEMDEDDGAMSAWYMFAQMGLYPVCVGSDKYELFTPLFSRITLHLSEGDVTIRRKCKEGKSASRITVDGKALDGRTLSHSQLIGSRLIVFE